MFVGIGFACPPVVLPPLLDHFQAKMNVSLVASPEAAVSDQAVQECSLGFSVDNPPSFFAKLGRSEDQFVEWVAKPHVEKMNPHQDNEHVGRNSPLGGMECGEGTAHQACRVAALVSNTGDIIVNKFFFHNCSNHVEACTVS